MRESRSALRLVDPQCDRATDEARRFANKTADALQVVPVYDDLMAAVADCAHVIGTSARPREQDLGAALSLPAVQPWLAQRGRATWPWFLATKPPGSTTSLAVPGYVQPAAPGPYQLQSQRRGEHCALSPGHRPEAHGPSKIGAAESPAAQVVAAGSEEVDAAGLAVGEREGLIRYWLGTLERFGYFEHFGNRLGFSKKFRQLWRRMPLRREDGHILRACLSQFNFKHFGSKAPEMAQTGRAPSPDAGSGDAEPAEKEDVNDER